MILRSGCRNGPMASEGILLCMLGSYPAGVELRVATMCLVPIVVDDALPGQP